MLLTESYPQTELPTALRTMYGHLVQLANHLNANGWTVIGSYYKTPNLHPWKDKTKDELLSLALANLASGRANSINLRLSDSHVIALDCDFHNPKLMSEFVESVTLLLAISPLSLYTCSGGKGGKLFFKYRAPNNGAESLPAKLGLLAFDGEANDKFKQELEIKNLLSTVAGLHSPLTDAYSTIYDFKMYGAYEHTKHIAMATPDSLPEISKIELIEIGRLYTNLVMAHGFVNRENKPLANGSYDQLIISSICYFVEQQLMTQGCPIKELKFNQEALDEITPVYKALGLHDGLKCINYLFYGERLDSDKLLKLSARYKQGILSVCDKNGDSAIMNYTAKCNELMARFEQRLQCKANALRWPEAKNLSLYELQSWFIRKDHDLRQVKACDR